MDFRTYQTYIDILEHELVPAMGCTEPIAIAYAAARAREVLGNAPQKILVLASGNIIKNVKSVVVPNSGGRKGIKVAAVLGTFFGDPAKELEVIESVTKEEQEELEGLLEQTEVKVKALSSEHVLDIEIHEYFEAEEVSVRIWDKHTNVVSIKKNGKFLYRSEDTKAQEIMSDEGICKSLDYELLTVKNIYEFARTVNISDIEDIITRQIENNMAISEEGMKHSYGARIGQIIAMQDSSVRTLARAKAAAASDARMGGCDLPVVINSGSGNQGITTSVPIIVYAQHYNKSQEELIRAMVLGNLVTLHLKTGIGRLSSYCGAVSAGVGAGAGIAFLLGGDLRIIEHTIVNAIAISSGIVCDGAKASCAAKIATAVDCGIFGYEMIMQDSQLRAGEGLVSKGVENTIQNINRLGHDGMKETDNKIIEIMTE